MKYWDIEIYVSILNKLKYTWKYRYIETKYWIYIYIYRNIEIFRYWNIDVKIYWNIEIYIEIYVSILKYRYIEYIWKLKYWEKEILKYR